MTKRGTCLERLQFKIFEVLKAKFEPMGMKHEDLQRSMLAMRPKVKLRKQSVMKITTQHAAEDFKQFEQRKRATMGANIDFDKLS